MRWFLFCSGLALMLQACSGGGSAIATYQGGEITIIELAKFLDGHPQAAGKMGNEGWVRARIAELFQIKTKVTEEELLFLKTHANYQKQLDRATQLSLSEAYLDQTMPNFIVEADEIAAFLENQLPANAGEERRVVQNIFLRYPTDGDPNGKAEVRTKAEGLRKQLLAGAVFEEIAKAHSDSATAVRGGFFGVITRNDLREPLASVVFALKPGELSEVVANESGCHIFLLKKVAAQPGNQTQNRRELAERRLSNQMKKEWLQTHLMEWLIEKKQPLSRWPQEPAGENGLLFSYGGKNLTVGDVQRANPNKSTQRDTFLSMVGELIFADAFQQANPEQATVIASETEARTALKFLKRQSLLAEIKALPEQKLYDHYLQFQKRFSIQERFAVDWFGWEIGSGDPRQFFEQPKAFAEALVAGTSAGMEPPLRQKIEQTTRRRFNQSHRDLARHLPGLLFDKQIIQPFRLANLVLVLRIVEHQPAEVIPYNNLTDQIPRDYLRTHQQAMEKAWAERVAKSKGFQIEEKMLSRFLLVWDPSKPIVAEEP